MKTTNDKSKKGNISKRIFLRAIQAKDAEIPKNGSQYKFPFAIALVLTVFITFFSGYSFAGVDVISSSENELKVKASIPPIRFGEQQLPDGNFYSVLVVPSAGELAIGSPDVPGFGSWILIPNGRNVSILVEKGIPVTYENINLPPVQPSASDTRGAEEPPFTRNDAVFSTDADYPGYFAETEAVKYKRGQACTILWIYPYQYNPVSKTLTVYPDLEVTVEFLGVTQPIPSNLINKNSKQLLKSISINGETVLSAEEQAIGNGMDGKTFSDGCEMMIITHPNFKKAADTLAQWKRRKGISTYVLSINTTDPFVIEDSINDAYETWDPAPSYLLFLGDAEFVPTWHINNHYNGGSQGRVGSDIFYADYDDPADHVPDFGYGRLSVDTQAQADSLVERIIRYESSPPEYSDYYIDALVAACFQDGYSSDGTNYAPDSIADRRFAKTAEDVKNYLDNRGFVTQRVYVTYNGCPNNNNPVIPKYWSNRDQYVMDNDTAGVEIPSYLQMPDFAWDGDANDITSKVNSGLFFLLHRDHGARDGWEDPEFRSANVDNLNNGEKRPVIWSINCQTGWFDNETDDTVCSTGNTDECFVEHWLRHSSGGSCGILAATRVSPSSINNRLVWGWMDAIWPSFLEMNGDTTNDNDFDNNTAIYKMGDVLNYGKEYMQIKVTTSSRRQTALEEYHWFGDPTMEMWTEEPIQLTSLNLKDAIVEGVDKVGVKVAPEVEDMLVAVYSEDKKELYGTGYTDEDGLAVIDLCEAVELGEKLRLTASKHDYLPKEKFITVATGESGYITANKTWSDDTIKVVGDITIEKGVTLTINTGVYVEFQGHYEINVYGRLLAQGSETDTIVFTPKSTTTGWHGIRFFDTDINGQSSSKLVYCKLEHGKAESVIYTHEGDGGAILCVNSSGVLIDHCLITQNEAASGGGIYCNNSDIEIKNSEIRNNSSAIGGGITCTDGSDPDIYNVLIVDNEVTQKGGGLFCYLKSSPTLIKVMINDNSSDANGGGVYLEGYINDWPEPVFDSVTISNNSAELWGGGIYSKNRSNPELAHSAITGNSAGEYGGGIACYYSGPELVNVTISNNEADLLGGGIYCYSHGSPSIKNCILWDDTPDEIYDTLWSNPTVTYSDVEGGYTGTGNINSDPLFYATTGDSAYYLTADSPCLNTGDPLSPHDPDGSTTDMGAYYYHHIEVIFPPTANFKADTTYGYYPVSISFSDLSQHGTAAITNWFWDFGDDSTSVLQNPAHTYTKDSSFTVSLIVTDTNNIKDTLIKTDYIMIVAAPPIADFSADTTEWYKYFTVNFTDESTDGSEGIDEWNWDFGDDSISSLQHPTHIYQDTGTYTVTLMVKDQNDSTDIKVKTDYITVLPGTYIAGGYVSGTWTKANEPYVIGGEITVHANNSLTIDPGVKVLFLGHHKFVINGQLSAQGNANDSIVFTAHNIWQGWHGLRFINSNSSVLEYCLIQYGNATGTASVQDSCGGGIYCENSPIQISYCLIGQNLAYKHGGGIYCELSDIQISNSKLQYNTAYEFGGGIYGFDSGITATGDTLERNEADFGGGIYCEGDPFPMLMEVLLDKNIAFTSGGGIFCRQGGSINIQQSTLIGNVANGNGAGIYFGANTNPILEGVTIEDNDAGSNGGGLFFNGSSAPSFTNITIVRNSATKGGGMFFNGFNDTNITLFDIPVTMNSAGNGGGIYYNNSSGPGLINVQITGNSAGGENAFGGGIYFNQSSPNLSNITLRLNTAFSFQGAYGGGMYLYNSSNPNLSNFTINSNSAYGRMYSGGGGIFCDLNSSPVIEYSTICLNITSCEQAPPLGGGLYCSNGSGPDLVNVTIANNEAVSGAGGGIYCTGLVSNPTNPTLKNCIMWDDIPTEIVVVNSGSVTATYSDIEGGWTGITNINSDPLFEDPMVEDYHLTWPNYPIPGAKSPCIDTGDPASLPDPDGTTADIGAFYYDQNIIPESYDFGDIPDPLYPTWLMNNGARHFIDGNVYLGSTVDSDPDGQPTADAKGDDNDGNNDDDGVAFNPAFVPGATVPITVTASVGGYLNAWCDFNADGDWDDISEQIFTDEALVAGTNSLNINIPATATIDTTFCRFRFNTAGGLGYDGEATDGEVEDYQVIIAELNLEDLAVWHFDEGQGAIAYDATDNQNDGAISGALWTNGCYGSSALSFDGNDDKVTVPHSTSLDITEPFSVQAVIKCTGQDNYYAIVDKFKYNASDSKGFAFYLSGGKLRISIYSGANGNGGKIGTTNLRDSECHHVFTSWDGDTIRLYVDGNLEGKSAWAYAPGSTTQNLGIGYRLSGHGGTMPFKGTIDEVVISSDPTLKIDYGDAPDPTYPTLSTNNGAFHFVNPDIYLGNLIDSENDGIPDGLSLGDDNAGYDDEDGVIFTSVIFPGKQACLEVTASVDGILNAWMDFNIDGDWNDTGEQIFVDEDISAGINSISFAVPPDAIPGNTFTRFRFSMVGGLSYEGFAPNGEVEDYQVEIAGEVSSWSEGFEVYELNSDIVGQGGWEMWGGLSSSPTARVISDMSHSGNISLKIRGKADQTGDDIVHQFNGCTTEVWELSAWQYIPSNASGGTTYLILLNQYECDGSNYNWSTQIKFDPDLNIVESNNDGSTLTLIKNEWVKVIVIIDLDNDTQSIYYDGQLLVTKSWTDGLSGGGELNIAAINLFSNTLENVDVFYDDFILRPITTQTLNIYEGWSGISTSIDPVLQDVETILAPISSDVEIMYNLYGLFWPGQSVNTLGDWDETSGYIIKVNDDVSLEINGTELQFNTVDLSQGWNLIPVYSQVDAMSVLGGLPGFIVAKGIATSEILWPGFNIYTLPILQPGKAYMIYMTQPGSFTYPAGSTKSFDPVNNTQIISTPWNDYHISPSTHVVAFATGSLEMLNPGDLIGAFTEDGMCAGVATVINREQPLALLLMGDDLTTGAIDGFITEEKIHFKCYKSTTKITVDLEVTFNDGFDNSGEFQPNGLSAIAILNSGFNETVDHVLKIYPNPSNGVFNICGNVSKVSIQVFNSFGMIILNNETMLPEKIDLSGRPAGMYFIRIVSDKGCWFNKLIVE